MAITLSHFCTKTGKPIIADNEPIAETIEHCLAEYFAPNATFKLGVVYQGLTTEEDLKQFTPEGLTLQFAADNRFYFMDEELREKVFDQPHFGAAYGSNMFTPCQSFSERENLRVLVVDAQTGENGGVMPNAEAIKLVRDGDGKIDAVLHQSLGNEQATPFQTRFGIKERRTELDINNDIHKTWQLGKGTFAPRDLSQVGNGYDLVISTEQLKGRTGEEWGSGRGGEKEGGSERGRERGKERDYAGVIEAKNNLVKQSLTPISLAPSLDSSPHSPTPPLSPSSNSPTPPITPSPAPLKPGEYLMKMGIGNKTNAYYGITSTGAQFWNSFPRGVEGDVLPRLQRRLEELKDIADDPRKIAQDYINSIDAKCLAQIQAQTESEDLIDFESLDLGDIENLIDDMFLSNDCEQNLIYRILKADLKEHCQILEHPKIIDKLQEHLRQQYMDCATGRFIKFDSAMAQTCHDLEKNEVCYPKFPDGAELIIYRGPTANSNTVDVYINRHLPNEPYDIGTIKMSPQGLKHSLSDCDGDRMAIALSSDFPHTAAEIKQKQLKENCYSKIIKPEKKSYTGSFEQIALDAMENKIGVVANLCMKGIALENECISIPPKEASKFIQDISCAAVEMLKRQNQYPENLRTQIVELAQLCQPEMQNQTKKNLSSIPESKIENLLEKIGKFYHDVVGTLGGQLQIEVDRGKSANRSDHNIVNSCNTILKSFDIAPWVEERKSSEVYTKKTMNIKGHGAIDKMATMTNQAFAQNAIVPRSTQQFQTFFKGVEFTPAQKQKAVSIKKIYDSLIRRAIHISREVKQAPGLKIVAANPQGSQIEIVGLAQKKHPNIFDNRKLNIALVENKTEFNKTVNKWIAIAPVFDERGNPVLRSNGKQQRKHLGYISEVSLEKFQGRIKPFTEFNNLTKKIEPGLTPSQVRAAFKQVKEFATTTRETISDSEKEAVAAAMWQISTASKDDAQYGFKKTSAAFAIFGEELIGRLEQLQFTEFAIVGTHKPCNEHLGRKWVGEKVECNIEQAPDPANPTQNKRWLIAEDKKLGVFRSESAQLPIGTSFTAEITSPASASVIVTSTKGNQLKVGQLKKYEAADREWKGEEGIIKIKLYNVGKAIKPIALIDDKPLGEIDKESFKILSEKLNARGIKVEGFKFEGKLESLPATIAHIKVDSQTVRYPYIWTKEEVLVKDKKVSLLDELKPILNEIYQEKSNQGLLHDDEASLGILPIKNEYFESFLQEKNIDAEIFKQLSDEIDKKFGVESLIGIANKDNIEELYFCVTVPTEVSEQKTAARINDNLNFPLQYDQLQDGQRIKFMAIELNELRQLINQTESQTKQLTTQLTEVKAINEKVSDVKNHIEKDISAAVPRDAALKVKREEWEKQMLKLALASLKENPANTGEEIQTATFSDDKYRVIHHVPSEMLRIVDDEESHRGTLYKVQKGKPVQVCKFTENEKKSFEHDAKQQHLKNLQQE
ncbi:hypothetical protein [Rivularia sp. UHCC 0363]|uniref:hypothetical protein n=1 Tax=Rivularia sp. UHCC 0363 TaxID=3110244 RepID=UPI002B21B0B6|nr:hypothetical protein [Rivularia sp. UHCC 0363]MEA5594725.1 hypothetical protein [Rivularia sp. UHCC 0363]